MLLLFTIVCEAFELRQKQQRPLLARAAVLIRPAEMPAEVCGAALRKQMAAAVSHPRRLFIFEFTTRCFACARPTARRCACGRRAASPQTTGRRAARRCADAR